MIVLTYSKGNKSMSKRYTLQLVEDDEGKLSVTLPTDLTDELGWTDGDTLEYTEEEFGTLCLEKYEP